MENTLIGKKYRPIDNSYSVNITTASIYPYKNKERLLAGTIDIEPKTCIIASEPFDCNIFNQHAGELQIYKMIMVEYDNETNMVLFFEHSIID